MPNLINNTPIRNTHLGTRSSSTKHQFPLGNEERKYEEKKERRKEKTGEDDDDETWHHA